MTSLHTQNRDFENVMPTEDGYSFDYLNETYFVSVPPNPNLHELFDTLYRATDFAAEHAAQVRKELDNGYI